MKNGITSNLAVLLQSIKTPSILVLAFLILGITTDVQATDKIKAAPIEIKHVGTIDGKPVFEINVKSLEADNAQLSIVDESGFTLYSEVVKEKNYSRKVQFENLEFTDVKVSVTLKSKKGLHTQDFKITKNTRLVQDVQIAVL